MAMKSFGVMRFFCSAVLASAVLSGCGGSSSPSKPTLSGVAAVGVPIVGGNVTIACAGGSGLTTTTDTAGAWTVTTSGQTLPCAIQVNAGTVGGVANTTPYHSIAISFGTINITPLTDLAVAQLLGTAPATWFASPVFTGVDAAALTAALSQVNTNLGLTSTLGSTDPFTTAFVPQNGVLLDDVLEAIKTTLTNLGQNYAALLAAAQANNYATNFSGFGTQFGTVYVSIAGANGPTTGAKSCATGETLMAFSANSGVSSSYSTGQGVCFTGSSSALTFSGKTLTNPVQNTAVTSPYSGYKFTDSSNSYEYEVIFNGSALYEINLSVSSQYAGQFAPTAIAAGPGTLTIVTNISGIATPAVVVSGVTTPANQSDFCSNILTDNSLTSLTANGGSLTINSCSYSGKVGTIAATLTVTTPVNFSTQYSITYTYN